MEWEPVESSMCKAVAYDDETAEMAVRWSNNTVTIYGSDGYPVPKDIYELVKVGSVGKNIHALIRGQYPDRPGHGL